MIRSLPKPRVPWDPVYELLRCLGEVSPGRSDLSAQCLTLLAGMQGGAAIDEWLLWELLALAGVDRNDSADVKEVAEAVAPLHGAGLLLIELEAASPLAAALEQDEEGVAGGFADRDRLFARVVEQMRRVEVGLRAAMEIAEATEADEEP